MTNENKTNPFSWILMLVYLIAGDILIFRFFPHDFYTLFAIVIWYGIADIIAKKNLE